MKKAISISIGGIVFNIEEDAYSSLRKYLSHLQRIFENSEGGDEIMEDIEIRISELFDQKIKTSSQAVNQSNVDEIISILGQPEDYQTESDFEETKGNSNESHTYVKEKRIYRDVDNKIVAGVCSGLAHYFGWDVTWLRLVFVLMFFFPPAIITIYIVLWIVFPKAITTSEKLHMRGKSVTIENIKEKVDQSFEEVKETLNKVSEKNGLGKFLDSIFNFVGHVFNLLIQFFGVIIKVLGKVFKVVFGLIFIFFGLTISLAILAAIFTTDTVLINSTSIGTSSIPFDLLEPIFIHGESSLTMLIIGSLMVFIPLLFTFFYLGSKLLFRYQTKIKGWGYMVFISMLTGSILLTVVGIRTGVAFSNQTEVVEKFYTQGDHLEIDLFDDPYFSSQLRHHETDFVDLLAIENDSIIIGYNIRLDLESTNNDQFRIEIKKSSGGASKMDAIDNINRMNYRYEEYNDRLLLSPNLIIPSEDKYHGQEIDITVYIPNGKTLSLGNNIHRIYFRDWRKCSDDYRDRNCNGETFINNHGMITTLSWGKEMERVEESTNQNEVIN